MYFSQDRFMMSVTLSVTAFQRSAIALSCTVLALLAGCDTLPGKPAAQGTASTARAPASSGTAHAAGPAGATVAGSATGAAASAPLPAGLADGIALYGKGDDNGAIRRLSQPDVAGPAAPRPTQLAALKYSAFSYCLTSRQTMCRQQFDKALKLDPTFDLEAGEHGHPLWEPVFAKAKKSVVK
jgi:hypothetical protein